MRQEIQIAGTWRESEGARRQRQRKVLLEEAENYLKRLLQEFARRNSESGFQKEVQHG